MESDDWEQALWTAPTRGAFDAASARAVAALRNLVQTIASSSREDTLEESIQESEEVLRHALVVLGDAALDYAGQPLFPDLAVPEDFDDESEPLDQTADHSQFSLLQRRDYRVTSQAAVMEEGRNAYRYLYPDAEPEALEAEVASLGDALRHMTHAGGTDVLQQIEGLEPKFGITLFTAREHLLTDDELLDEISEPAIHFQDTGEVFVMHTDVWT